MQRNQNLKALVMSTAMVAVLFFGASGLGINEASAAGGPPPWAPMPIFESNGNVSLDNGAGWWYFQQYDDRARLDVGAYSTERIIRAEKRMVVDKYDPSRFSFSILMQTLDDVVPSGKLNFSSYSSMGENSISLNVHDGLQDVFVGWDHDKWEPIYEQQMRANFWANMFVDGWVNSVNDSSGKWTSSWYDGNGDLYFQQTGDQFTVYGNGTFDDINVGLGLVKSGMATLGVVNATPEPGTMALLAIGGAAAMLRRKRRN